jgi:hypothetical protein
MIPPQETLGNHPDGPGREIKKLVRRLWSEEGWELMWLVKTPPSFNYIHQRLFLRIVNPPSIQSVKAIPHLHLFIREKIIDAHR